MGRKRKIFSYVVLSFLLVVIIFAGTVLLLNPGLFGIVDTSLLTNYRPAETSWVFDNQGNSILCFAVERRTVIPLKEVGGLLSSVVIAAEDKHFYSRWGPIDMERSVVAVWQGKGGSTISQQLSRLVYLQEERRQEDFWASRIKDETNALKEKYTRRARFWQKTKITSLKMRKTYAKYTRKIRETYIAYRLEKILGRERVLEIYLNHVYFGERYGVAEASMSYFGKSPTELNLSEAALLAGLIRSPYYSSPFQNLKKAKELRNRVIQQLVDSKMVDPEEAEVLKEKPLGVNRPTACREFSPHFAELVRRELTKRYTTEEIWKGGLKTYTTLDMRVQKIAEDALRDSIKKLIERNSDLSGDIRGAAVVIDVLAGGILAWVEVPEFSENEYDLISQAKRQIGSAFKGIFYGKLLERGWRLGCDDEGSGPCTLYDIEPRPIENPKVGLRVPMGRGKLPHAIQNFPYEGIPRYRGFISPQIALTESRNAATVSAVSGIKGSPVPPFWRIKIVGELDEFAKRIGIESKIDPSLTTPIGSTEVTLLEMTRAFATYARGCKKVKEYFIEGIKNSKGEPVEWHTAKNPELVCDERTYLQIVRGLRGTVELPHGTGTQAKVLEFQVFGKTGTATNNAGEATDNWFIGCSPSYCMGVWVGRDKKLPLGYKESGGKNALPVFIAVMRAIYQDREKETFPEATNPLKPFVMSKEYLKEQLKSEEVAEPETPEDRDGY
ncbi:MAG: transglycosylase domain-containing protein [bacterium]|nr:transglycosylase domain-containing protein [bacterium]